MKHESEGTDDSDSSRPGVVPVVIVDQHFWESARLFNGNAFPSHIRPDATLCGDRLAILAHSAELIRNEPGLDRSQLLSTIRTHPSFEGFEPRPDKIPVVVFHNLGFMSGVYSALVALKSMLDLYARLVARSLVPSASLFGFNKSPFRGRKRSGGRLLNWIEKSAPKSFENGDQLVATLLRHLDEWLEEAIDLRDAVIHEGGIPGLVEATVSLERGLQPLRETDITLPTMPSGEAVTDYCTRLVHNTRILASETLPLLPGIDHSLLRFYDGNTLGGANE